MAFDYTSSAASATELLTEFGQAVTHTSIATGAYDPDARAPARTSTAQSGVGVLLELSTKEAGVLQAAGVLVTVNDRKLLLSVSGIVVAPKPDDTVTVAGLSYTVAQVKTLSPAGVPVMYELMIRR